jgi:hypothetical protein
MRGGLPGQAVGSRAEGIEPDRAMLAALGIRQATSGGKAGQN